MYYELFRIKDSVVQPVNSRESQIKEVREILIRDRDRNKEFAYKELGAVYWLADYRSPGRMNGYEDKDLLDDAIRNYDLPSTWQPDRYVTNLIKLYEYNNNGGIAAETLTEIVSTLNLMNKTTKAIRNKIKVKLEKVDVTEEELNNLINMQRQLFSASSEITKKIKDIKEAREMLKETESDQEVGRGNKVITSSMKA